MIVLEQSQHNTSQHIVDFIFRYDGIDYHLQRRFLASESFLGDLPYKKAAICSYLETHCNKYHLSQCNGTSGQSCFAGNIKVLGFIGKTLILAELQFPRTMPINSRSLQYIFSLGGMKQLKQPLTSSFSPKQRGSKWICTLPKKDPLMQKNCRM